MTLLKLSALIAPVNYVLQKMVKKLRYIYYFVLRKNIYYLSKSYERFLAFCLGKDFTRPKLSSNYMASKRYEVCSVLKHIPTRGRVFLDVGSGKGAVLYFVQKFPFKLILGVENDLDLYRISIENLSDCNSSRIKVISSNFENIPDTIFDSIDVFYLFNPFGAVQVDFFIEMLLRSKSRNPRRIDVLYKNPVHRVKFLSSKSVRFVKSYKFFISNSPTDHYSL